MELLLYGEAGGSGPPAEILISSKARRATECLFLSLSLSLMVNSVKK